MLQAPRSLISGVTFFVNTDLIYALKYGCPHKVSPTRVLPIAQILSWFYHHGSRSGGIPISTTYVMALTGLGEKAAKDVRRDMIRIGLLRPLALNNERQRLFAPGEALEGGSIEQWIERGREGAREAIRAVQDASRERLASFRESKRKEQAALDAAMGY